MLKEVFLSQLRYVIGEEKLAETIKRYYNDFKFKHPTPMTLNEAQNVFLS
jgi:aminopeptidase N